MTVCVNALTIELHFDEDYRTEIHLAGELDLVTADQFGDALRLTSDPVIVDVSRLGFIDSTGIGVLARAWRDGRDVKVRGAQGLVRRALLIVGFDAWLVD